MTSYDHAYDPARHQSRRHDSFRDQQQDYLNPNAGHDASKRSREHRRSVSRRREEHRDGERRYNDARPRSPYSSAQSSDDQRARNYRRSTLSWPPAPHAESEARSLAREAGGAARLRKLSKDDIPSRGTIDQDPVIQDVPEYANQAERGFVLLGRSQGGASNVPTPPSSDDERKKTQRRPSRINTDFSNLPPEMQTRVSSPYANSGTGAPRPTRVASNTFLSPDVLTPPASDVSLRRKTMGVDPQHNRSPRTSPTSRRARDYFSAESENAIDDSDSHSRPSSRGSQVRAGAQQPGHGVSSHDFAKITPLDRDSRRQTFAGDSKPRGMDRPGRPSPLVAAAAAGALGEAVRNVRDNAPPRSATLNPGFLRESSGGSRNVSPAASIHSQRSASPPPSSRLARRSTDYSQEYNLSSPESRRASVISSRTGSRPGTPPLGHVAMPKMPQSDDEWSAAMASNAARRLGASSKPPSRLSAAMRADSLPTVPRSMSSSMSSRSGGGLPYPVNAGPATPTAFMPQEAEHQWFPTIAADEPRRAIAKPTQQHDGPARQPRHSFTTAKDAKSARPDLVSQQSIGDVRPARMDASSVATRGHPAKTARPELVTHPSTTEVRPTRQEAEAMLKRGLPGCSRPLHVAGYDDWYTLIGAQSLDFCPKCIDLFERTVYRKCFRKSLPRPLHTKIRCAFSTPWIRLAYLLSVQERLPNLKLMKDLANIDEECDPCPGHQVAVRTWHGLRDDQGLFVHNFNICQADILKLQRLLPTFKGFFQPLPGNAMYEKRRCALRPETNRFSQYLDAIIGLHDDAVARDTTPNRMPLVALVEKKLAYRECERDTLLVSGVWHYIPSLPAFTVCEDCFEEIVEPEASKGSDVAKRFNRAVQLNHGEGPLGTSCQLYSPRMRQVFSRAVKDGDLKYLARKAKERREAQLRLQERRDSLLRKGQRIAPEGWPGSSGAEEQREKRRIDRELADVMAEWREDWE